MTNRGSIRLAMGHSCYDWLFSHLLLGCNF